MAHRLERQISMSPSSQPPAETIVSNPELFLIDAIAPFFIGYEKRVINWSKIPFTNLEKGDRLDLSKIERILDAYARFITRIRELGFNAVTIDDIAHMAVFDFYPEALQSKLLEYREFYQSIFEITRRKGLKIYVTTDIMFFNASIERQYGRGFNRIAGLLEHALAKVFSRFPAVDGVVFRIGETDGTDVVGDFSSQLVIKTPEGANRLIKHLMPLFEDFKKQLIFRTWTVGSYRIGDLIWNRETFDKTFADIRSPNLIISMKYGDTDFFSAIKVNPLFYQLRDHQVLLELQSRRERELFGNLPYYVGWDYERYQRRLKAMKNRVGISVWCQTGGWSRNNRLTFLESEPGWNELNAIAAIKIFRDEASADEVVSGFFDDPEKLSFLKSFHDLLYRILYIPGFAEKTLYFRRTRIPPLLWMTWDYVTVNPMISGLYRAFSHGDLGVDESQIEAVRLRGRQLGIERIDFYCDTLLLFRQCARTILGKHTTRDLIKEVDEYRNRWPDCNMKFKLAAEDKVPRLFQALIPVMIREQARYRMIDHIMMSRWLSWTQMKLLEIINADQLPKYANKRAMRLDVLFR